MDTRGVIDPMQTSDQLNDDIYSFQRGCCIVSDTSNVCYASEMVVPAKSESSRFQNFPLKSFLILLL